MKTTKAMLPNGRGYTFTKQEDNRVLADFGDGPEWENFSREEVAGHVACREAYLAKAAERKAKEDRRYAIEQAQNAVCKLIATLGKTWSTNEASGIDWPEEIESAVKSLSGRRGIPLYLPTKEDAETAIRAGASSITLADAVAKLNSL